MIRAEFRSGFLVPRRPWRLLLGALGVARCAELRAVCQTGPFWPLELPSPKEGELE